MTNKIILFIFLGFQILFGVLATAPAISQTLSPQAQAIYQGVLKVAREAMESPDITRAQFEKKIAALMKGNDDDQKTAKAGAMAMFDSIELVHALKKAESNIDYVKIFDGKRYRSQDDLTKQKKLLSRVNEIILATINSGTASISRLEEELKRAKVSEARLKTEIESAKKSEIETKAQMETGWRNLQQKVTLNEARIDALDFLGKTFGTWSYTENFQFSSAAEQDEFNRLLKIVGKEETALSALLK